MRTPRNVMTSERGCYKSRSKDNALRDIGGEMAVSASGTFTGTVGPRSTTGLCDDSQGGVRDRAPENGLI